MKNRVIAIAKELRDRVDCTDMISGQFDASIRECLSMDFPDVCLDEDAFTRLKILVAGFCSGEDPALADRLLLGCAADASLANLELVFKKLNALSDEALALGMKYATVPETRPAVAKLFVKNGVSFEEAHIYNIKALQSVIAHRSRGIAGPAHAALTRLFGTINTNEFKTTKHALHSLPFSAALDYLPVLTERGILNYKELAAGDVFRHGIIEGSMHHPSETVRVEYFKKMVSYDSIVEFFTYNQFISGLYNQKSLITYFKNKLIEFNSSENCKVTKISDSKKQHEESTVSSGIRGLVMKARTKELDERNIMLKSRPRIECFNDFLATMADSIAVKMCKSPILVRRHLGAHILACLVEYMDDIGKYARLIDELIYDKSHEVRKAVAVCCPRMSSLYNRPIANLLSDSSYLICGAIEYLKRYDAGELMGVLKEKYAEEYVPAMATRSDLRSCTPIHGLIRCLAEMHLHDLSELEMIVHALYSYALGREDEVSWRIMSECLFFYHKRGRADMLLKALLVTDHFGIICNAKMYLSMANAGAIEYLPLGIGAIMNKKKNTRKSGGLCLFFVSLIRDKESYEHVKQSLAELLFGGAAASTAAAPVHITASESVAFHCLNVFRSILENHYYDDVLFYMNASFTCLLHSSFNIKNCGCAIFSALLRSIFVRYGSIDSLFLANRRVREAVHQFLVRAIEHRESLLAYFILSIYARTRSLSVAEKDAIGRSMAMGEFVEARAMRILKRIEDEKDGMAGDNSTVPENDSTKHPIHGPERESGENIKGVMKPLPECEALFGIFETLNSNDHEKTEKAKAYLNEAYGLKLSSTEYAKHWLLALAVGEGYYTHFKAGIENMNKKNQNTANAEDATHAMDIDYDLDALASYQQ